MNANSTHHPLIFCLRSKQPNSICFMHFYMISEKNKLINDRKVMHTKHYLKQIFTFWNTGHTLRKTVCWRGFVRVELCKMFRIPSRACVHWRSVRHVRINLLYLSFNSESGLTAPRQCDITGLVKRFSYHISSSRPPQQPAASSKLSINRNTASWKMEFFSHSSGDTLQPEPGWQQF